MVNGFRQYMVGDMVSVKIMVKHQANLIGAVVFFETDEGDEFGLEWEPDRIRDPDEGMRLPGRDQLINLTLSGRIRAHISPGIYKVRSIGLNTAGDHWIRIHGEKLGDIASVAVEIVKETWSKTAVTTLWFPSDEEL